MQRFFILIYLVSMSLVAAAQGGKTLITVNFQNTSFVEVVEKVETMSPYYFYYDLSDIKDIKISIKAANISINELLARVFKGSDIFFAVDEQMKYVFVSKQVKLQTNLFANENEENTQSGKNSLPDIVAVKDLKNATSPDDTLYEIGIKSNDRRSKNIIITGYIRNFKTGEPIVGGVVFENKLKLSSTTDQYGFYTLSLPPGIHHLNVQGSGMKDLIYQVNILSEGKMNFDLSEKIVSLKEVIVSTQKVINIQRVQMGVEGLTIQTIKKIPTVFGEADILKAVLTLPGVKTVGEASTGFNVRGGSADQNLILFNDATIFNPSHFFGLFSAFNPEIIKDIKLYKSSIPAKYGGRLSSVLDITGKEGNKKNFTGSAGIGPVTSRFNLEGPIAKEKTSFIFGGRATYADWLLKLLPQNYKKSKAFFYDANLIISHKIDAKNDLYITSYISQDRFNLNSDTAYEYGNQNINLKWKHVWNNKLSSVFTIGDDRYTYTISSDQNPVNAYKLNFNINQFYGKADFNYFINSKHALSFGLNSILYKLHPGNYNPLDKLSLVKPETVEAEQGIESGIYIADQFKISQKISLEAGLRYSMFNFMGPKNVTTYKSGLPRDEVNKLPTTFYDKGKFINTYAGPEYRASLRYAVTNSFSLKGGYNSSRQYIHVLSNTTAIAPTDIWKLSDPNITPQQGQQLSFGVYKNLKSNTIETSIEVYYKKIKDYLDYKPGAKLVLNHNIETDVINTRGKAYGIEFSLKKTEGKVTGWVSYTYSRILLQLNDPASGTTINNGAYYPANYDKPHDITLVGNFKINQRVGVSWNVTYSTGRPITLPVARFYYAGSQRVLYSNRNEYRVPDYFRTDVSMNIEGNYKIKQKTHNSWTFGFYNLTARKNAYSVYFVSESGVINGYKLSIFGSIIPFVNYNIRF